MMKKFLIVLLPLLFSATLVDAASFQMRRDENGNYLYMTGQIQKGDVGRMHRAFKAGRRAAFLRVNSPGGHAEEALKLADYMGKNRIEVRLLGTDHCISACAIMIMGAKNRLMGQRALIGLHAPYFQVQKTLRAAGTPAGSIGSGPKAVYRKKLYALAIRNRISQRYVDIMLKMTNPRTYYPVKAQEAKQLKVVSRILPR